MRTSPTSPVAYQQRFAMAMKQYQPSEIELLFVAEAPLAYYANRLFYFLDLRKDDTLFLEMMKVMYPTETGFRANHFLADYSAKRMREQKATLLGKFKQDRYFLIDAYQEPMPDKASRADKERLMHGSLPKLIDKVRDLTQWKGPPIILIGSVTFDVCAEALRSDGLNVINRAMINHPARGGQVQFRQKLKTELARAESTVRHPSNASQLRSANS